MKNIVSSLLLFSVCSQIMYPLIALGEQGEERTFVVTAYYSPLPNQSFYLRGNYEDEIILNGEGTHGASGRAVFAGMLAAPKNYPFGTKIELSGLGIGSVEDRGGAIVNAGKRGYEHDRIDVWMGHGEEGLKKALNWGKRKVKGTVYGKVNTNPTISLARMKSETTTNKKQTYAFSIFTTSIGKDSKSEEIKALQKFLKEIQIYTGEIDGVYNLALINTIYTFQKDQNIVKTPDDIGAGYWGFQTRKKVQELSQAGFFTKKEKQKEAKEFDIFTTSIGPKSPKEHIQALQKLFTELEYYDDEISGEYKDIIDTLIDYQLENGIIQEKSESVAGLFGPKTREKTQQDYLKFQEKKKQEEAFIKKMEEIQLRNTEKVEKEIQGILEVKKGDTSLFVRKLQNTLKKLGYFEYDDTAIFGDKTEEAIFIYQKDKKLVENMENAGAGKIGPKTLEILKNDLINLYIKEEVTGSEITKK